MSDDNKHTERVTVWLTEREFLDLMRMSERADRKAGEMARVIVRRFMYGNVGVSEADNNVANRAETRGTP
jgi:hypothetical protein